MIKKSVYLEPAPAKINLYLEVLPKDSQAKYHDIRTVFQAIDLMDYLTIEILMAADESPAEEVDFEISLDSNNPIVRDLAVNNSVVAAVEAFFMHLPDPVVEQVSRVEVSVFIDKQIPLEAGLAGGSANAAATLRALNKFITENFSVSVPAETLAKIALELGSDVPFCLASLQQPRVYAEGRGEEFMTKDLSAYDDYEQVILVKPEFGVNTAAAYARLSSTLTAADHRDEPYFNRFEETVLAAHPELAQLKTQLLELGAARVMLSGSGSTMIAFVARTDDATPIYQDIIKHYPDHQIYMAKMLAATASGKSNI